MTRKMKEAQHVISGVLSENESINDSDFVGRIMIWSKKWIY